MSKEAIKLIVTDNGDSSVGIYPQSWQLETPLCDANDKDCLEYFREAISKLYTEFSEGRIRAEYDFELKNYKDSDGE